jgi:hypothetical protein
MPQRSIPYPGRFLLAIAVATLLLLVLGWHVYASTRVIRQIGSELEQQAEAITAARRLDAALDAGLGLPEDAPERAGFSALINLARRLGMVERQAEALDLLHSPEQVETTRVLCAEADAHAKMC